MKLVAIQTDFLHFIFVQLISPQVCLIWHQDHYLKTTLLPSTQISQTLSSDCQQYKTALCTDKLLLQPSFRGSALPSCLAYVTRGPLLFSQVFQVTTNRHCGHPKQDVAAKQESLENKYEFSPSLSEARGTSQAEQMSGCLCIIFQGVMTLLPIVSLHLFLNPISLCSDHLW